MEKIQAFLEYHGLPTLVSDIIGRPFVYVFAEDGEEWSGIITGLHIGKMRKQIMIDTTGWFTDWGKNFVIDEVEIEDEEHAEKTEKIRPLRRKKIKKLQLFEVDEYEFFEGTFHILK